MRGTVRGNPVVGKRLCLDLVESTLFSRPLLVVSHTPTGLMFWNYLAKVCIVRLKGVVPMG